MSLGCGGEDSSEGMSLQWRAAINLVEEIESFVSPAEYAKKAAGMIRTWLEFTTYTQDVKGVQGKMAYNISDLLTVYINTKKEYLF